MQWEKNVLVFKMTTFKAGLENKKAPLENKNAYSVNCTRKFVFCFQDNSAV